MQGHGGFATPTAEAAPLFAGIAAILPYWLVRRRHRGMADGRGEVALISLNQTDS